MSVSNFELALSGVWAMSMRCQLWHLSYYLLIIFMLLLIINHKQRVRETERGRKKCLRHMPLHLRRWRWVSFLSSSNSNSNYNYNCNFNSSCSSRDQTAISWELHSRRVALMKTDSFRFALHEKLVWILYVFCYDLISISSFAGITWKSVVVA